MDSAAFNASLASAASISPQQADSLLETLSQILASLAEEGETLVIPRLGTFTPVKEDERVDIDLTTGRRVLLPPNIHLEFTSGGALRKAAREKGGKR